jgi:hypothetical protein
MFESSIGLIGKSGKYYPCKTGKHGEVGFAKRYDAPFITVHNSNYIAFDALGIDHATKEQFQTLIKYCIAMGVMIENVAIGYWEWFDIPYHEVMSK